MATLLATSNARTSSQIRSMPIWKMPSAAASRSSSAGNSSMNSAVTAPLSLLKAKGSGNHLEQQHLYLVTS